MATKNSRKSLLNITFIALFAAFIAGGTFISIPMVPVPVVLANFFALLGGLVLGPVSGVAAVALYLLAGALGAPVFSGFQGGFGRFAGPTGGFLIGYLLMPLVAGFIVCGTKERVSLGRLIAASGLGLLVAYVPGVLWLKLSAELAWPQALVSGFLLFIPGDILKGVAAVFIAPRLGRTASGFLNA